MCRLNQILNKFWEDRSNEFNDLALRDNTNLSRVMSVMKEKAIDSMGKKRNAPEESKRKAKKKDKPKEVSKQAYKQSFKKEDKKLLSENPMLYVFVLTRIPLVQSLKKSYRSSRNTFE